MSRYMRWRWAHGCSDSECEEWVIKHFGNSVELSACDFVNGGKQDGIVLSPPLFYLSSGRLPVSLLIRFLSPHSASPR